MKKVLYVLALVASLAMTVSSCTEEVVKPKDGNTTAGSGGGATQTKGS